MSIPLRLARQWTNHGVCADAVAFSPDGRSYVSCGEDGSVVIVAVADAESSPHVLQSPCDVWVRSVGWQGNRIVTGDSHGTMKIWDATARTLLANIKAHDYYARVSISPVAPHWIVTGGYERLVKIWTLDGEPVRTLDVHIRGMCVVRVSPDGRLFASESSGHTVALWDLTTGTLRSLLSGHSDWVRVVSFADDGTLVASGSDDMTIRVWTVRDGSLRTTLRGYAHRVWGVAFIGKILVSGSEDKTVKVWQDDQPLQSVQLDTPVYSMCVSTDGSKMVVGCRNGQVQLFDVFFEARQTRRHNVYILLAHLERVEVMTGYAKHYVQYHVLPELPWQAWL